MLVFIAVVSFSREENNNGKKTDKIHVKEWLHQSARRPVKIRFGPDESFHLLNRKGEKLRSVSVKGVESLVLEVTQDTNKKPCLLYTSPSPRDS